VFVKNKRVGQKGRGERKQLINGRVSGRGKGKRRRERETDVFEKGGPLMWLVP